MGSSSQQQQQQQKGGGDNKAGNVNVWSSILTEVRSNASAKLPSGRAVVLLGASESGKTTLVAKLQGIEDPKKGCGLEYAYIEIRDEDRDDSTQLGVYTLDGNPCHAPLLTFPLNSSSSLKSTLIILTVSMATPWLIMEQLEHWAAVLMDHIDSLSLPPDDVKLLRNKILRNWVDYIEPGNDEESVTNSKSNRSSRVIDGDDFDFGSGGGLDGTVASAIQLGDGILGRNTGLEIIVVVTKTDTITQLEKDSDYRDEHFDFIQYSIRKFCLNYGAALFYTSVKEDKNCDLLYKYLVHRIYGLGFRTPALVVEKEAVFVPAGWDNIKKMNILQENMNSFKCEDFYGDVVPRPIVAVVGRKTPLLTTTTPNTNTTTRSSSGEEEISVEEEQKFLERQLQILHHQQQQSSGGGPHHQKIGSSASKSASAASSVAHLTPDNNKRSLVGNLQVHHSSASGGGIQGQSSVSPKKAGGDQTSERVLANFFNSLLSKKASPSSGNNNPPSPSPSSNNNSLNNGTDC